MILKSDKIQLNIVESVDSKAKDALLKFKTVVKKDEIKTDSIVIAKVIEQGGVGQSAITAVLATMAIFVRFFVVVDIVINLFGKINVELGPNIKKIVNFLKNLQFPTIGFAQQSSPIDDGGDKAIKDYDDYTEKKNESAKNSTQPIIIKGGLAPKDKNTGK